MRNVPKDELDERMARFRRKMDIQNQDWEFAVIFSKINQFYFTGTMQEGMLLIPRNNEAELWVRRSYERAVDESLFPIIRQMESFREATAFFQNIPDTVYLETEFVPMAMYQRFQKYFPFKHIKPLDLQVASVRLLKASMNWI